MQRAVGGEGAAMTSLKTAIPVDEQAIIRWVKLRSA
jgi:hypothetical protein